MKKAILVSESMSYLLMVILISIVVVMNFNISKTPTGMAVSQKQTKDLHPQCLSDDECYPLYCGHEILEPKTNKMSERYSCVECQSDSECSNEKSCIKGKCMYPI